MCPKRLSEIGQLPVVTKAELMSHFNDWVTDPSVTRAQIEAFLADPGNVGRDFLGRYVVCTTSGATGIPAILLHDHTALVVYNVLGYARSLPALLLSPGPVWALLRGRGRLAAVFVTGGHFLGNTMMARRIRKMPWRARMQRIFSALAPVAELVSDLNAFQPVVLGGYPSALETLAREQQAGRLHIHPVLINAAGETLSTAKRQLIGTAFGCRVGNYYGSSEAVGLTYECAAQRLHVNSDWYVLEPVDEHDRPVPPGQLSDGVLVTNLANRIQPIIRYQMGDRVTMDADPCPCGSPFPSIHVVGRTDDILTFPTPRRRRGSDPAAGHRHSGRRNARRGRLPAHSAHTIESDRSPARGKPPRRRSGMGCTTKPVGGLLVCPRSNHGHDREGRRSARAASTQRKVPGGLLRAHT